MTIALGDTSRESKNLGDNIIMESVLRELRLHNIVISSHCISTHSRMNASERDVLRESDIIILGGTNLAAPNMLRSPWKIHPSDARYARGKFVFCGVGWKKYSKRTSNYTKWLFSQILSRDYLHSVRDKYTEKKLREIGFDNVITTGCPTLWNLGAGRKPRTVTQKNKNVVFTLTDYRKSVRLDRALVKILARHYDSLFFWPQGSGDDRYLKQLRLSSAVNVLKRSLDDYDQLLSSNMSLDYVGTRLHGGIRAIQNGVRSFIIGVDNRALEMAEFGIKVVPRQEVEFRLENEIYANSIGHVRIPKNAIDRWIQQFKG